MAVMKRNALVKLISLIKMALDDTVSTESANDISTEAEYPSFIGDNVISAKVEEHSSTGEQSVSVILNSGTYVVYAESITSQDGTMTITDGDSMSVTNLSTEGHAQFNNIVYIKENDTEYTVKASGCSNIYGTRVKAVRIGGVSSDIYNTLDEVNGGGVLMSVYDKLNGLKETKEEIAKAIISKGVPVESTDTFRSYANKVKEISGGEYR